MENSITNLRVPVDAHCHLFNKEILSWRLLIDYINARVHAPSDRAVAMAKKEGRFDPIKRALKFLKIGFSSTEDVYKELLKAEVDYAVIPLMFDLDYCMKGADGKDDQEIYNEILATYREMLERDRKELISARPRVMPQSANAANDDITEMINDIDLLLNAERTTTLSRGKDTFKAQENELIALKKRHPGKVFPFFAVDPRRKENYKFSNGKFDLTPIIKRLAINGGDFYGIKLYAPNGYSPSDPMLMALYEYCQAHEVPVTAHCSGTGFASFAKTVPVHGHIYRNRKIEVFNGNLTFQHYKLTDKNRVAEKATTLNHPLLWEEVLKVYPKLKLNLAHFGNKEGDPEWTLHIFRMMDKYPNLYTDFSCVSDASTLKTMYNDFYVKASASKKKRFLYGSDFYLNMLFINTMEDYLNHFKTTFSANEFEEIAIENPTVFLRSR